MAHGFSGMKCLLSIICDFLGISAFDAAEDGAEHGNALAQINLGRHYYDGRGVAQDYTEAVE